MTDTTAAPPRAPEEGQTAELLSLTRAAARMGISAYRLNGLIDDGKIFPVEVGRRRQISTSEIARYLGPRPRGEFEIPGLRVDYRQLAARLRSAPGARVALTSPLDGRATGVSPDDADFAARRRLMRIDGITPAMARDLPDADDYWFDTTTYDVIARDESGWRVALPAPTAVAVHDDPHPTLLHWTLVNTLRSTNVLEAVRELHERGGE